jgi:cell division protein FtsB
MKRVLSNKKILFFLSLILVLFFFKLNIQQENYKKNFKLTEQTAFKNDSIENVMIEIDSIILNIHSKKEEKELKPSQIKNKIKLKNDKVENLNFNFETIYLKSENRDTFRNSIVINDTIINKIFMHDTIKITYVDTVFYQKKIIKNFKFRKNK